MGKDQDNTKQHIEYKLYPNPVESELYLDYFLSKATKVRIAIYSVTDGKLHCRKGLKQREKGNHQEQLDCSNLPQDTYVLQIITDTEVLTEKFIKK